MLNKKTKIMIAGIVVLLLILAGVAVYSTMNGSADGVEGEFESEEQAAQALTDSQKELIRGYGSQESDFVSRLSDGIWTNAGETETIEFTDSTFTLTSNYKESETHTYAIQTIEETDSVNADVESGTTASSTRRKTLTASVETDEGYQIFTMNLPVGTQTNPTLKSEMFGTTTYIGTQIGQNIKVVGLDDEFLMIFADGGNDLIRTVQLKGAESYPTATEAEWDGTATIDYEKRTVTTGFTFNNKSNSKTNIEVEF